MSIDFGNGRENGLGLEVGAENETMTGDLNEARRDGVLDMYLIMTVWSPFLCWDRD